MTDAESGIVMFIGSTGNTASAGRIPEKRSGTRDASSSAAKIRSGCRTVAPKDSDVHDESRRATFTSLNCWVPY